MACCSGMPQVGAGAAFINGQKPRYQWISSYFFGYHWTIDNKPNHNNHKIWYKHWQTFIGDGLLIGFTMFTSWHPRSETPESITSSFGRRRCICQAHHLAAENDEKSSENRWMFHGFPWISVGFWMDFHGLLMEFLWIFTLACCRSFGWSTTSLNSAPLGGRSLNLSQFRFPKNLPSYHRIPQKALVFYFEYWVRILVKQ